MLVFGKLFHCIKILVAVVYELACSAALVVLSPGTFRAILQRFKLRLQAIMMKSSKILKEKLTAKAAIWTQSMTNEYLMLHCSFVMLDCFWYFSAISPISLLHIATTFFMVFFQSALFIAFSTKVWAASVSTSSFLMRLSFLKISCSDFCGARGN